MINDFGILSCFVLATRFSEQITPADTCAASISSNFQCIILLSKCAKNAKQILCSASDKDWANDYQRKYNTNTLSTEQILCSVGNNGWEKD